MTLLEEACGLIRERFDHTVGCDKRFDGRRACTCRRNWNERARAFLARAEAGDQGADVEARTVEAIAAWLFDTYRKHPGLDTDELEDMCICIREMTWKGAKS